MDTQRFLLFLFAQADSMRITEAIELGTLLGKSPSAVRGSVSRLKRGGLLTRVAVGRNKTGYSLSPTGKAIARNVSEKFVQIHAIVQERDPWDGTWTLVSFDIAEKIRNKRDRFRIHLKELGFGQLTSGIWIAPRDTSARIQELAASLHIGQKVIILLSKEISLGTKPVSLHVNRIWPLARLNRKYFGMKRRMNQRLVQLRNAIQAGKPLSAREAFLELFCVFCEAVELVEQDPCLPQELLPKNWLGLETQDLIHEYFHIIHGLELNDPYAYLLSPPAGLDIPAPRPNPRSVLS